MSTLPQVPATRPALAKAAPNGAPSPSPSPAAPGGTVLKFRKATKEAALLRLALIGASKSGKTYTALAIAKGLGGRIAVVDTEHGSASKYAGPNATPHGFEFDVLELDSFHPRAYIDAIRAAEAEGYDTLIIDSLSHEWEGPDGALELVDRAAKKYAGNTFAAWSDVTPMHRELIEVLLKSRCHVIATMRTKTEYVIEEVKGKKVPRKVGTIPVQRPGIEYEFDVAAELSQDHEFRVEGSRCDAINDRSFHKAGADVAQILKTWLASDGKAPAAPPVVHRDPKPESVPIAIPVEPDVTAAEAKAAREITPALERATKPEEVEVLRLEAVLAAPLDPADATGAKRKPSPAYGVWYQAAFKAAFARVGGAS